jgi:hypothetical protein
VRVWLLGKTLRAEVLVGSSAWVLVAVSEVTGKNWWIWKSCVAELLVSTFFPVRAD